MQPGSNPDGVEEAFRMLDTFASVGARSFDLTHLDIDGNKRGFRANQTLRQLRISLPILMTNAPPRRNSIVIRPHAAPPVLLVQIDDLDAPALHRLKPFTCLTLCTSPGNHQAWIALESGDGDFARRLRQGSGADPSASGATRVAGTTNFKRKYEPDFPVIRILDAHPGRMVTKEQLEEAGLVKRPEPKKEAPSSPLRASGPSRARGVWPSYEFCVQNAPLNHSKTGPDISIADWEWCRTAYDWGWPVESIAQRLMLLSTKAQENGERYAERTAARAAVSVDARQQRGRG